MVATANGSIALRVRYYICMFLPLVTLHRQVLVSSHLNLRAPINLVCRAAAQYQPHRHHHLCARHINTNTRGSCFANTPPFGVSASLKKRIVSFSTRQVMTPPYMSAVEETTPSSSSTSAANTSSDNKATTMMTAKLVPATLSSLQQCGQRLRSGDLVSFPTETVYGLGCHALDPTAVQKVFDAKERPLSDPLIVHVTKVEDALDLWEASSSKNNDNDRGGNERTIEKQALHILAKHFFPGPLTIVAKAHPSIPQILMANTGYVACRSPSHPVARALIDAAQCPIAAPSANKFGHVSPTLAKHVMDDLGNEDVWIIDPNLGVDVENDNMPQDGDNDNNDAVCQVGVESTVAKIEMHEDISSPTVGSITILRHGAISSQDIQEVLKKENLGIHFAVSDSVKFTSEKVHNVAPGQTVKHYSPNVPCFMVSSSRQLVQSTGDATKLDEEELRVLSQSVIIDYGRRLSHYKQHALAYCDLSPEGDASVAAASVFKTLRWSETIEGAIRVFVPEIVMEKNESEQQQAREGAALVLAVKDKLTRAASAVVVKAFQ